MGFVSSGRAKHLGYLGRSRSQPGQTRPASKAIEEVCIAPDGRIGMCDWASMHGMVSCFAKK